MKLLFITISPSIYRVHQRCSYGYDPHEANLRFDTWNEVLQFCKEAAPIDFLEIVVYIRDRLPVEFPDCQELQLAWRWLPFETSWFDGLSRIPSLKRLHVFNIKFDRVPSSLRLRQLTLTCRTPPYWMLENTGLKIYSDGNRDWRESLCTLHDLLTTFLVRPQTPFGRWLTRGLYDPRLFALIRDFLL